MNRLIVINIPQIVKKRKYEVDINKLQKLLRERKKAKQLTNKDISKLLEIPRTMAEHYFRTDKYFDVPDSDNWQKLREILDIHDPNLDLQIMSFEYVDGNFDKSERHYFEGGIAPTILAGLSEKIVVSCKKYLVNKNSTQRLGMNQIIVVGNIYDDTNEFCSNGRVYGGGGIAPTIGASNFAREKYVLETINNYGISQDKTGN